MTNPSDEGQFLNDLESEVQADLTMAEASHPEEQYGVPVAEWTFEPTDVEREEIRFRSLLGAVEALEADDGLHPPNGR